MGIPLQLNAFITPSEIPLRALTNSNFLSCFVFPTSPNIGQFGGFMVSVSQVEACLPNWMVGSPGNEAKKIS